MAYWPHIYLLILILCIWLLERRWPEFMAAIEENILVGIISSIMLVSFGQVIARYGFNSGWAAALEFNTLAFSWLILLGMSYGVKTSIHIGVDIVLNAVSKPVTRIMALTGAVGCMFYGLILLDSTWLQLLGVDVRGGAIEYWAKMYQIGIGSEELRYPEFAQEMFGLQPRVHRWLVLVILPISLALLVYRSLQAFVDIYTGKRRMLISGHEGQEMVEENRGIIKD
ncbi:MAG: TRAP transporter small permease [Oceanospirillaceae bacterium]|nr:TRAP transporter small permease [Oceanospirillaceae bacterium]